MPLIQDRGVPPLEHPATAKGVSLEKGASFDWDNARIFLEVVRCGSFRSAAERLGQSINVIRRRVDDFERKIGAILFTRDVHGTRLTEEAAKVVSAVERMEAASFDLMRARDMVGPQVKGEVRVAVTEGLGTFCAAAAAGRIPAILPEYSSRLALRHAIRRGVAA